MRRNIAHHPHPGLADGENAPRTLIDQFAAFAAISFDLAAQHATIE
jgi:hypothetical protein